MAIQTFEDITAWQKSKELYLSLYTDLLRSKEYVLRDQLLRSALTISNTIAQGFEQGSKKEFRQAVLTARGSAAEVRSMLYIGLELNILPVRKVPHYLTLVKEITRLLTGMAQSLQPKVPTAHDKRS